MKPLCKGFLDGPKDGKAMMEIKKEIVTNWLKRYTGRPLDQFTPYLLLCNFTGYLKLFAEKYDAEIVGLDTPMPSASNANITILSFGMGSPNAATIMDLLSAVMPKAVVFIGKCGGLKARLKVGEYILPIAAIRGEGTGNDYFPPEIPSLPSFKTLLACSDVLAAKQIPYAAGTIYTTNRRVWEHDHEFKAYLASTHAEGIDMETATLFTVGYANRIPVGALLMISDTPMTPEGVKTEESDLRVSKDFMRQHLDLGIDTLRNICEGRPQLKNIRFDW